jgi:hypothetical protein
VVALHVIDELGDTLAVTAVVFIGTANEKLDWQPDTVLVMMTLYDPAKVAVVAAVFVDPDIPGPVQE